MKIPEQDDFDKNFQDVQKQMMDNSGAVFRAGVIGTIFTLLVGLAVLGGLGYVAWHFLAKVW